MRAWQKDNICKLEHVFSMSFRNKYLWTSRLKTYIYGFRDRRRALVMQWLPLWSPYIHSCFEQEFIESKPFFSLSSCHLLGVVRICLVSFDYARVFFTRLSTCVELNLVHDSRKPLIWKSVQGTVQNCIFFLWYLQQSTDKTSYSFHRPI